MEALEQLYTKGKEEYLRLVEKSKSIDYQKLLADAQKVGTEAATDLSTDPVGTLDRYQKTATETVNEGVAMVTDTVNDQLDPEAKYQKTHWFTTLPPKKNYMSKIFDQMDREKGIRTSGKIRIDYTDKSGNPVRTYVYPSSLKYLSMRNPADESKTLSSGKEIQSVADKKYWGRLASRRSEGDGWNLDNGKHVLDITYNVKWQIVTPSIGPDAVHDGDGVGMIGDYDSIWFKTAPPQSDTKAYELYSEVDPRESISTDGFYRGNIALLYTDKEGDISMGYYDLGILQYMTQKDPAVEASKQLSPGTEIRSVLDKQSWSALSARRSDDSGWDLSNGRHVLDATYNVKWEVSEPMSEEDVE